jgi:hypothetical protein
VSQSPFGSTEVLGDAFAAGLERQLEDGGLGAFILVVANASFEADLWERMRDRLRPAHERLAQRIRSRLRAGEQLIDAQDDQLVFLKLVAMELDALGPTEYRCPDGWELQHNLIRGLRPQRFASEVADGIRTPFDPHCFNFTLAFLDKELLWQGEMNGHSVRFYYNKFPFVRRHLLMVPHADTCRPQYLTREMLFYAWRLLDGFGDRLDGAGIGYNSYGAFASVNHLHFQLFERPEPLPVESARWRHNGGAEAYPAPCIVADSAAAAWELVRDLHHGSQAYNLLLRPGRLYALPRRLQGSYTASDWAPGHAWYEMAGGAVISRRPVFERIGAPELVAELSRVGAEPAG